MLSETFNLKVGHDTATLSLKRNSQDVANLIFGTDCMADFQCVSESWKTFSVNQSLGSDNSAIMVSFRQMANPLEILRTPERIAMFKRLADHLILSLNGNSNFANALGELQKFVNLIV